MTSSGISGKRGTLRHGPANPSLSWRASFTLFNELLRDLIGLRVFLDSEDGTRLSRRLERDVRERGRTKESVIRQWEFDCAAYAANCSFNLADPLQTWFYPDATMGSITT